MKDVPLIKSFDPWRSSLCTCPPKLTFNPYTGCDHNCVYCYASSYIPRFSDCRAKKEAISALKREAPKLKGKTISLANSSDPYPRIETTEGLTRKCLEVLAKNKCKIQIITKSDLVVRDIDLLRETPSSVALTITSDDDSLAKLIEPDAPLSSRRFKAVENLTKKEFPVSVRIDPIIPLVNDKPQKLIADLASAGVKHITCSTYKAKPDNWLRLGKAMPKVADQLKAMYFCHSKKVGGSLLLPEEFRFKLLKNIRDMVLTNGMRFGVCREGLSQLNTASCDGSWLIPQG